MAQWVETLANNRIAVAVVGIVLGTMLLVAQSAALDFIVQLIGIVALVAAAVFAIMYFKDNRIDGLRAVLAVIFAIAGIVFLAAPWLIVDFLPFLIGIAILAAGVFNLGQALSLSHAGDLTWKKMLLTAVVLLVLGLAITLHPGFLADFVIALAGAGLVVCSALDLYVQMKARA